jgi:DNA-binding CsgD family transcriptional regulator
MRAEVFSKIVSLVYDAAVTPDLWPKALEAIGEATGGVGAAYLIKNRQTHRVDWVNLAGPSAVMKTEYVNYYAARDPFNQVLEAAGNGWRRVSRDVPGAVLRKDEWYNDFVLKMGVRDIIGVQILERRSHIGLFGIHQASRRQLDLSRSELSRLLTTLHSAADVQFELESQRWRSAIALSALDEVVAGVVFTDSDARVVETNLAAEQILRLGDGLTVRSTKLCATRTFENSKLHKLVAAATAEKQGSTAGRMLVARKSGRSSYILTVAPLNISLTAFDRPLAIVLVSDPEAQCLRESDVADLYGLSPAESRLAVALTAGNTLREIAESSDVRSSTLRTQLSSILQKVGVARQVDLIRALASVPVLTRRSSR